MPSQGITNVNRVRSNSLPTAKENTKEEQVNLFNNNNNKIDHSHPSKLRFITDLVSTIKVMQSSKEGLTSTNAKEKITRIVKFPFHFVMEAESKKGVSTFFIAHNNNETFCELKVDIDKVILTNKLDNNVEEIPHTPFINRQEYSATHTQSIASEKRNHGIDTTKQPDVNHKNKVKKNVLAKQYEESLERRDARENRGWLYKLFVASPVALVFGLIKSIIIQPIKDISRYIRHITNHNRLLLGFLGIIFIPVATPIKLLITPFQIYKELTRGSSTKWEMMFIKNNFITDDYYTDEDNYTDEDDNIMTYEEMTRSEWPERCYPAPHNKPTSQTWSGWRGGS